jgi:UDP-glucose 4-epimerase
MQASPSVPRHSSVLVAGGLGFIGGHLVDRLVASGADEIRVVDNHQRAVCASKEWPQKTVSRHDADIREYPSLKRVMQGCQVVYHLAAQAKVLSSVSDPDYTFNTNVGGTRNILRAAGELGVRRVVFTSSREVYGNRDRTPTSEDTPLSPFNEYGASKAAGEMYCHAAAEHGAVEVSILRLANVYGPYDQDRVVPRFVQAAVRGYPLIVYGGDQIIDFVWIDTVIDALIQIGFGGYVSGPINIGSGVGVTVSQLAARVLQLVRSKSVCVHKPSRDVEVKGFVADTRRAQKLLEFPAVQDPLIHLPELISWARIPNGAVSRRDGQIAEDLS